MRKLLFSLLWLPFMTFGVNLPSHFGNEISVIGTGYVLNGDLSDIEVNVQFTSSKLFKEKLYLSTVGNLTKGKGAGLGLSAFLKVNSYLFLGGEVLSDSSFELSNKLVMLSSFKVRDEGLIEPFMSVDLNEHYFTNLGVRIYILSKFSLILCLNNLAQYALNEEDKNRVDFSVGISFPIRDFEFLEDLIPDTKKVRNAPVPSHLIK